VVEHSDLGATPAALLFQQTKKVQKNTKSSEAPVSKSVLSQNFRLTLHRDSQLSKPKRDYMTGADI
jgi:hypothetical protein